VLSITRTSAKLTKLAWHRNMGLMNNPKRFNVATSRGKALAIFVGNPNVIIKDDNWKELLELCMERGVYRGVACPAMGILASDSAPTEDLIYSSLLGGGFMEDEDDIAAAYASEMPWRVMM